jgi:hypothetical protein
MEAICSSETSVDFQWTAWRYIPEDRNIQSTLKINQHKILRSDHKRLTKWLYLPPAFTLIFCSVYSSTLKMEATCASETAVDFQLTTLQYILEDWTVHNHRRGNLTTCLVSSTLLSICINPLERFSWRVPLMALSIFTSKLLCASCSVFVHDIIKKSHKNNRSECSSMMATMTWKLFF